MSFPNNGDLIKPWDWNLPLELVVWLFVIVLVGGIWLWARSGAYRKHLPDILGRNIEDFAGIAQEGNGPIPLFLLVFYLVVGLFIIGYPIVTLIFNYNY
jgi:RsiW-degrading membrane proteinase PrsW (M82 family)